MKRGEPVRFGVLGTGRISRKVGAAIADTPAAELAAVGSRNGNRSAEWAREMGAARSHGSYEELLDDEGLDAVYIALPSSLHAEWAIRAADRGLHVLCEKPLATNVEDAEAMVAACERRGVQLMDGVMWVHTPRATVMREMIRSGAIGTPRRVTSAFTIHPDAWTSEEPRMRAELGGGSLLDLGWYCVAAALWVFGMEPERVLATSQWRAGVDVATSALMEFPDDPEGGSRVASFDCGFVTAMRKWIEIAGDQGSLVCDDFPRARPGTPPRFWHNGRWGAGEEVRCETSWQERDLVEAFCRPLREGRVERACVQESLAVQRVVARIEKSARTGKPA